MRKQILVSLTLALIVPSVTWAAPKQPAGYVHQSWGDGYVDSPSWTAHGDVFGFFYVLGGKDNFLRNDGSINFVGMTDKSLRYSSQPIFQPSEIVMTKKYVYFGSKENYAGLYRVNKTTHEIDTLWQQAGDTTFDIQVSENDEWVIFQSHTKGTQVLNTISQDIKEISEFLHIPAESREVFDSSKVVLVGRKFAYPLLGWVDSDVHVFNPQTVTTQSYTIPNLTQFTLIQPQASTQDDKIIVRTVGNNELDYFLLNTKTDSVTKRQTALGEGAEVIAQDGSHLLWSNGVSYSYMNALNGKECSVSNISGTSSPYEQYLAVDYPEDRHLKLSKGWLYWKTDGTIKGVNIECEKEPVNAHVASYSLIKTLENPAVYYVGPDRKRYGFPTTDVFFSWYNNFDDVQTVSSDALASFPLGGNVRFKPTTRLIKIESLPKVYAIGKGGTLHWIQSEELARELYGADWKSLVRDVPDTLFLDYTQDRQIISSTHYPRYRIWNSVPYINIDLGI